MNPNHSAPQPADSTLGPIEQALQITPFHIEQVLTLDGVPVNVEAVMCWHMPRAQEARTSLASQTSAVPMPSP